MATSLPFSLDSFVGRTRELAQLRDVLAGSRFVTVTGSAGIGKTRLALEVATDLAECYPHGVWMVDLSAVSDGALVTERVARELGIRESGDQDIAETLVGYLRERYLLLVIDNCEHVLEHCAALAARILQASASVSLLLTSREPLGIRGEHLLRLGPLALPRPGDKSTGGEGEDHGSRPIFPDGVELFVQRAEAVQPGFTGFLAAGGEQSFAAVADICRKADGVPLAIELLSGWVPSLSLSEIAARMDDGLALSSGNLRSTFARHHSMQVALDWSYDLLSDPQQALLRRLSIFAGGWSLDAAVHVCAGDPVGEREVVEVLSSLVAKSLVVADTSAGAMRYRLLETVRLYAAERLAAAGEAGVISEMHGRWCAELAEGAAVGLTGVNQLDWLARLDVEYDNLRAGLSWAISAGRGNDALRIAGGLVLFWRLRSHWREGQRWLQASLDADDDAGVDDDAVRRRLRAMVVWGDGCVALMVADVRLARQRFDEALKLATAAGDRALEARSLLLLGNEAQETRPTAATSLLERAAEIARDIGDAWCLGHALGLLGLTHLFKGEATAAQPFLDECLSVARHAGELQSLRLGLIVSGEMYEMRGDHGKAREALQEGLDVARQLGEPYAEATALRHLAQIALIEGALDLADELLDQAVDVSRRCGDPALVLQALQLSAQSAFGRGDMSTARHRFEEVIATCPQLEMSAAAALVGLGRVVAAQGDAGEAERLFRRGAEVARAHEDHRTFVVALSEQARLARDQAKFERAAELENAALRLAYEIDDHVSVGLSLEALACLAVDVGRLEHGARLFGAATGLRAQHRPVDGGPYDTELDTARAMLGAERFEAVWAEGRRLSPAEAVAYACRRRGSRNRPRRGWESLTAIELDVAALVAEGLTNRQIGDRLFISPRTVGNHLTRIYAKVGVASRGQLSREYARLPSADVEKGKTT